MKYSLLTALASAAFTLLCAELNSVGMRGTRVTAEIPVDIAVHPVAHTMFSYRYNNGYSVPGYKWGEDRLPPATGSDWADLPEARRLAYKWASASAVGQQVIVH